MHFHLKPRVFSFAFGCYRFNTQHTRTSFQGRVKFTWLIELHFLLSEVKSDKLWLCAAQFKKRDGSCARWLSQRWVCWWQRGGLRWIRYGFINEHQAGMAVAISYRVVSICKAERTRKSVKRREEMEWLQVKSEKQSWEIERPEQQ